MQSILAFSATPVAASPLDNHDAQTLSPEGEDQEQVFAQLLSEFSAQEDSCVEQSLSINDVSLVTSPFSESAFSLELDCVESEQLESNSIDAESLESAPLAAHSDIQGKAFLNGGEAQPITGQESDTLATFDDVPLSSTAVSSFNAHETDSHGESLSTDNSEDVSSMSAQGDSLLEPTRMSLGLNPETMPAESIEAERSADEDPEVSDNITNVEEVLAQSTTLHNRATNRENRGESAVNPILAQIESAQKTTTTISSVPAENPFEQGLNKSTTLGVQSASRSLSASQGEEQQSPLIASEDGAASLVAQQEKFDSLLGGLKTLPNSASLGATQAHLQSAQETNNALQSAAEVDKAASSGAAKIANVASAMSTAQATTALEQPLALQSKGAAEQLGERINMMINQGKQEVSIRLDPAELGSMHIKLQVQQDQVQVAIQTQAAQSRDIIDQHLPRLREQLEQQGINLGEATVEQQAQQQQSSSQHTQTQTAGSTNVAEGESEEQPEWRDVQMTAPAQGIDYYA